MLKGVEVSVTHEALYLHWLLYEQSPVGERQLRELYFLIAPEAPEWHEA